MGHCWTDIESAQGLDDAEVGLQPKVVSAKYKKLTIAQTLAIALYLLQILAFYRCHGPVAKAKVGRKE
jgi:hypothetical protein